MVVVDIRQRVQQIRDHIDTFCAFGSAPTFPSDMDEASDYLKGRTGTKISTHYNVFGVKETRLRNYASHSIMYRSTPAIIGTGWLKHYPLAYGYQWWSAKAGKHHFYYAAGHGGNQIILLDELDMVIVTSADRLYGNFGADAWEKEKAIIELVGKFIKSLPKE